MCEHGRIRSQCKECGGTGICEHGRVRCRCKECGGSSICKHGRKRCLCKECGGTGLCEHGRVRSDCKECGGGFFCMHGWKKVRCKEDACRAQWEAACRARAASCLHVRPPSLQHRAYKRQRETDDDSDDDEGMQMAMARSRADQQGASRLAASSSEAGPSSEAGSSSEAGLGWSSEAVLQPGMEAEQTCPICMDGCEGEPRGRPDPQEHMRGWGYTSCCGSSFHFDCMSTWLLDKDTVESTCGPVPLSSNCPVCRSNRLAPTSSRMLQGTKR